MVPHINEPVASFYTTVVESMKVHRANIENVLDENSEPILAIGDLSQLQIILLAYSMPHTITTHAVKNSCLCYHRLANYKFTVLLIE